MKPRAAPRMKCGAFIPRVELSLKGKLTMQYADLSCRWFLARCLLLALNAPVAQSIKDQVFIDCMNKYWVKTS